MINLFNGDCLEKLKLLDDNSIDSVVTDPPYFLTNSSGSGFMGKEWDSLSIKNAFAESVLKSLKPVWILGEVNTAQESANTNFKKQNLEQSFLALYVDRDSIDQKAKLNQRMFSVLQYVLTREEVLTLSRELCSSLTSVFESQPEDVLYVIPRLYTQTETIAIAQELALRLRTESVCEEIKTLHTLMADQEKTGLIEAMSGISLDSKSISVTSLAVENVASIVRERRYSAITLSHIGSGKIIQWIISSSCVRNAMQKFTENPSNIQILSEIFHYKWLIEVFRVLKPGGHILAFAGTRTYGRLSVAIEDAGFEIRDQIMWIYGSGFPKSMGISKAIDKQAGFKPKTSYIADSENKIFGQGKGKAAGVDRTPGINLSESAITNSAKQWQGWGTALKPANEPICLARKPISEKTVAANVLKHGTGAMNIDESRIDNQEAEENFRINIAKCAERTSLFGLETERAHSINTTGRWPANVIFDEEAGKVLDEQTGELGNNFRKNGGKVGLDNKGTPFGDNSRPPILLNDSGGASRFFYCAKASKSERNKGLEGMPKVISGGMSGTKDGTLKTGSGNERDNLNQNFHPTVKPIKLMEYLCKLITPPGGVVLDPFMGSGTTGIAATTNNFKFIGIERDEEYFKIAENRVRRNE